MGFPYPYPLGLPKGTVRATLTLSLSINLLYLSYFDLPDAETFSSVVAVALAFYFGGRIRGGDPSGEKSAGERAFALPAGTVRSILILLFAGYSFYLIYLDMTIPKYLLEVNYLISGYILGALFRKIFLKEKKDGVGLVQHLKSLIAIAITALAIFMSNVYPSEQLTLYSIQGASLFLGFYFGSRD